MAVRSRRGNFSPPPSRIQRQLLPVLTVMAGSMVTLLPIVATRVEVPPFGFLVLIGWRLLRSDIWPVWAPVPLGLFDDLFSGQPLGSAMALWTFAFLAIDYADRRSVWRDHWQDWGIAALLIAVEIVISSLIARTTGGAIPIVFLVPQIVASILVFPMISRLCATLDARRFAR